MTGEVVSWLSPSIVTTNMLSCTSPSSHERLDTNKVEVAGSKHGVLLEARGNGVGSNRCSPIWLTYLLPSFSLDQLFLRAN